MYIFHNQLTIVRQPSGNHNYLNKTVKTMYKRKDGLYEKSIMVNGKRHVFRAKTMKDVNRKILEFKEAQSKTTTWDEASESYLETLLDSDYAKYTIRTYREYLERLDTYLKGNVLADITPTDCYNLLQKFAQQGLSKATIATIKNVASNVFNHAIVTFPNSGITANPFYMVKIPIKATPPKKRKPITAEQRKIIMSTKKDEFLLPALILYTGTRVGEALALTYGDVDFENKKIYITKAMKYNSAIESPKTESGIREIPLLPDLEKLLNPKKPKSAYLLTGTNKPMTYDKMEDCWEQYFKDHGMVHPEERTQKGETVTVMASDFDRHTLRHEYCTILFEAGVDVKTASHILGHSDVAITMNIYAHIRDALLEDASQKLNDFFSQ